MNFICREDVLALAKLFVGPHSDLIVRIEALPMFPAPNPDEKDGRNVMGQTEDQFWNAVEDQYHPRKESMADARADEFTPPRYPSSADIGT